MMTREAEYFLFLLNVETTRFLAIMELYTIKKHIFNVYEKNAIEAMLAFIED